MKISMTIPINVMGKPRMTRRDRWAKRPAVLRWFAFKDRFNKAVEVAMKAQGMNLSDFNPEVVSWEAYIEMPDSWSKKKRAAMIGKYHRVKPDRDNIDKAILDSLFDNDAGVAAGKLTKLWCEQGEGRIWLGMSETEKVVHGETGV